MQRLERQRALIALVDRQGDLTLEEACRNFAISPATARRDFGEIATRGAAEKTWGGLRRKDTGALGAAGQMIPSDVRESVQPHEKQAIADIACSLVADGDAIIIDGGTTTLGLAAGLANRPVRILTNSLLVAHRIDRLRTAATGAEVFLTGGFVYPGSGLLVGPQATENLERMHASWAFLSCGGFDASGTTNTNQLVAEGELAIVRAAEKVAVLADASKWNRREMVRTLEWTDVSLLISDEAGRAAFANTLADRVKIRWAAPAAAAKR